MTMVRTLLDVRIGIRVLGGLRELGIAPVRDLKGVGKIRCNH